MKKVGTLIASILVTACSANTENGTVGSGNSAASSLNGTEVYTDSSGIRIATRPACNAGPNTVAVEKLAFCVPDSCNVQAKLESGEQVEAVLQKAATRYIARSDESGIADAKSLLRVRVTQPEGFPSAEAHSWKTIRYGLELADGTDFFDSSNAYPVGPETGVWGDRTELFFFTDDAGTSASPEVLDFVMEGTAEYWTVTAELDNKTGSMTENTEWVGSYEVQGLSYTCYQYEITEAQGNLAEATVAGCGISTSEMWLQDYECVGDDESYTYDDCVEEGNTSAECAGLPTGH